MPTFKAEILTAAIAGLEAKKTRIDDQISEIRAMLSGEPAAATAPESVPAKRKKFSAAARQRMALAQKARWAKIRGESEPAPVAQEPAKPKRRISAEGMKRIIAATKKRWRLQKAGKGPAQTKANR